MVVLLITDFLIQSTLVQEKKLSLLSFNQVQGLQ